PSRDDPGQVDAEIAQAGVIAEPAIVPHRIGGAVKFGVAGEIALADDVGVERRKLEFRCFGHVGLGSQSLLTMLAPPFIPWRSVRNTVIPGHKRRWEIRSIFNGDRSKVRLASTSAVEAEDAGGQRTAAGTT